LVKKCRLSAEKIEVVYNGLEYLPRNTDLIPILERKPHILTVANINQRKGHLEYLSVIQKVLIQIPQAKFIFVGRDDMNGIIQKKILEYKLEKSVILSGFQTDVSEFYKNAKLFVLPSLWGEGAPTSIIESLSWGIPVISYDVGGCSELVDDNINGYVIQPGNSKKLTEKIINLFNNNIQIKKMSNNGLVKARQYNLKNSSDKHEKIFHKLISST